MDACVCCESCKFAPVGLEASQETDMHDVPLLIKIYGRRCKNLTALTICAPRPTLFRLQHVQQRAHETSRFCLTLRHALNTCTSSVIQTVQIDPEQFLQLAPVNFISSLGRLSKAPQCL